MWQQATDPFHSVTLSAAVAAIPIAVLFGLLITKRLPGYAAALLTFAVAIVVAIAAFRMPPDLAAIAGIYGAMTGLFPIGWIVISAVFHYNLSVKCGSFDIVCRSIESITSDRRLQALLIAFCFGAFLEGCAGFGAPVAITAGMLVGLGFEPLYAAGICLLANSTPVAFGSIGIPIITAGKTAGLDPNLIGQMVAHQLPILLLITPLWLMVFMSGWKGAREVWPAILVSSVSYTVTMVLVATYMGPALPDILSSLVSLVSLVILFKFWKPATTWRFPHEDAHDGATVTAPGFADFARGWTPFLILILCVGNWGLPGVNAFLDSFTHVFKIGALSRIILPSHKALEVTFKLNWLAASGTSIFVAASLSILTLRIPAKMAGEALKATLVQLRNPLITISSIVGFAYLANYAGMTTALGNQLVATGQYFPLVSPIVGWIGVLVSGSDTSANALFSNMQKQAALNLGLNPLLTVSANTVGGVTAKMVSTQSIAVACASANLVGQEGLLFRRTLAHSLGLLAIICAITELQAHTLSSMIPGLPATTAALAKTGPVPMGLAGWGILCASITLLVAMLSVGKKRVRPRFRAPNDNEAPPTGEKGV